MPKKQADAPKNDEERKLNVIAALQREVDEAESEFEQASDTAKSLKKVFEAKAKKLFEYIRQLNAPMPLFEQWKQTPIAEIGLPDYITSILAEAGIDTIGKLAAHTESGKELTSIPHIGEAKARAIEDALERFWAKRKEDQPPNPPTEEPEETDEE